MSIQLSTSLRNTRADAITSAVGSAAKLRVYTGTAPTACADAATGTQLSEHTLGSPFAASASSGTLSPTLPSNVNVSNSGDAGYWRVYDSTGATCLAQGTCGTSGADMNLNTVSLTAGGPLQISSWAWLEGGA